MMAEPLNVLLVEDSPDDADLVLRELRKNGYNPYHERVQSYEQLSATLEKRAWDIIIADYSMPSFSGLEALKFIKSKNLDTPFILVSGTIGEEIAVSAMKAGAHDYVLKDKLTRLAPAVERELREAVVRKERKRLDEDRTRLLKELQEAVEMRDEFLSIASHELRTPLTPLQIHVQSLIRSLKKDPSTVGTDKLLENLEVADSQVQRLTKLVETLLDISRITAGRLDLHRAEVDLTALARGVGKRMEPEIIKVGSRLVVQSDGPVLGNWDEGRIDQVITNLLSNAIKYGPEKPVEISIGSNGREAHVSVRDYGVGIAKEDQKRIFGRFERALPSNHYGGFGLGLWIVSQIVHAHGGTIGVESRPGEGAIFDVRLPRNNDGK
jgi:signal transduction histidine kinase